ncbi:MAG: hypothetical protein IIC24_06945, partial [Chloroflexi bacterium]|nr:hypothetical protein [Chloroflexota bacterium]
MEDEASCEALDAKGGNPADPDELLGTWDLSSMTCTIEPVSPFGLTIVRVGSEDVLVIAAGVTLIINGSIIGELVIVDGDLVNNGTIVSGVSVSGVATNNGSIVGSVGVDGLVTNNGVINLLTGGPVDPDWLSVSADGELVNRGEILAGQVRNRGLVTNHGDVIIGGDAGSIGASGLWLDRQDAVTVNHGLFDNHGAAAGLQISHFIVEGARFTNYGEYIHGPTAGGGAMEIFSDGIFENIGSYTHLGPILFINYEFSP